jgi:predicted AAA+ superfamily ATPase
MNWGFYMPEMERKYRGRIVDGELKEKLSVFGGVLITGPKMCGKTWTGMRHAASSVFIDEGDNLTKARLAPELVLEGPRPRLVDEWQLESRLWDKGRRIIDRVHKPGCFIFTGSAVPGKAAAHTGTGRFVHLEMRPMSLYESGDSSGAVSLAELFRGKAVESAASSMDFKKAVHLICRGGWPAGLWLKKAAALSLPRGYLEIIVETDISRLDGVERSPDKLRLLLRSLARNSASLAGSSVILGDIREHETRGSLSPDTIAGYINALKRIFVVDEQRAWLPSLRSKTRIRTSPKRHFVDPSLAAAALDASPELLMEDPKTAGFLFESLCYRDLSIYVRPLGGRVYHYRDEKGLEVDALIQLNNGDWAAVEVKLGVFDFDLAAKNLVRLKKKMEDQTKPPVFLMILTASGGMAYTRSDGIHVVPLDCLGA